MKTEFRPLIVWAMIQLLVSSAPCNSSAQIAVPNFRMIGENLVSSKELWKSAQARVTPKQLAIDYTSTGVIYGMTCEYALNTNSFILLKKSAGDELGIPAKIDQPAFCLWRSEQRKITITLELDSHNQCVRLIVVSVDKNIRKSAGNRLLPGDRRYACLSKAISPPRLAT